ncbi:MAG: hypothetical protein M1837_001860 [Sclerophora amabilis]|nr:MAG: hypothetical protein M1837_001860 [Sclerophora amabilis]
MAALPSFEVAGDCSSHSPADVENPLQTRSSSPVSSEETSLPTDSMVTVRLSDSDVSSHDTPISKTMALEIEESSLPDHDDTSRDSIAEDDTRLPEAMAPEIEGPSSPDLGDESRDSIVEDDTQFSEATALEIEGPSSTGHDDKSRDSGAEAHPRHPEVMGLEIEGPSSTDHTDEAHESIEGAETTNTLFSNVETVHTGVETGLPTSSLVLEPIQNKVEESPDAGKSTNQSETSENLTEVDWDELERNEEQEPRDEGSDESTAFLLARLEQENNALATDPKAGLSKTPNVHSSRPRNQSRPPSIHHLKKLVDEPTRPSLRYSLLPAPPPMTDLEFYAALVADYHRTAQCLPTLLSKKIRSGIPPPLRGVVWISMAGARDSLLGDQYETLSGESSPYENMIGKDIGRSFPGVEMFRDPEGEGQRLLGQVLKCFSLYDQKIGYCQGLGFVVGPLLMHMGGKEAFCVLVRFMEQYDLRSCFLPDLSGLHLRIYQFKHLLAQHLPAVSHHLDKLQIEPAYLSQWFLSFFGVTCPVPMLLRIYDVIFAEGAAETMMRVALSVMRRNEKKILASPEFEDVMQLLLSRGLWDTYGADADEFVNDFVGLTGVVTHEGLQSLEAAFKNAESGDLDPKIESSPGLQAATSSFLGRLWTTSPSPAKSATLAPGLSAPSRPISFLRRSPSKQSVTSTLDSMEGGSETSASTLATDFSAMSRDSSTDCFSSKSKPNSLSSAAVSTIQRGDSKNRDLHGQIEDLLTALNEMQREQAVLVAQLQQEREEREEDHKVVSGLVDRLRQRQPLQTVDEGEDLKHGQAEGLSEEIMSEEISPAGVAPPRPEDFSEALNLVETRLVALSNPRLSTVKETKHQLRAELNKVKEQHSFEISKSQHAKLRLTEQDQELVTLREGLKDARSRIREAHQEKQRMEKTIQDLQSRKSSFTSSDSYCESSATTSPIAAEARSSVYGGLREFKLNRSLSSRSHTAPVFSKRTSSLNTAALLMPDDPEPPEQDNLLAELVTSKTAEAVAKQEAEELRAKLESLRKLIAVSTSDADNRSGHGPSLSLSLGERKPTFNSPSTTSSAGSSAVPESQAVSPIPTPSSNSSGGFWSGWGKRSGSQAPPTESR